MSTHQGSTARPRARVLASVIAGIGLSVGVAIAVQASSSPAAADRQPEVAVMSATATNDGTPGGVVVADEAPTVVEQPSVVLGPAVVMERDGVIRER